MNVFEYYKINDNYVFIVCLKVEIDFWFKIYYGFEVMNGYVFYNEMMIDF